jgi:predicted RNA-binding protein with PUA-like domain
MNYWLLKSEPDTFSIDALAERPRRTTAWDGVRNYQARNMLRDSIKKGDLAFFYHSSCASPGIAGIVSVVKSGYPESDPRWYAVDVRLERRLRRIITLEALRQHQGGALAEFILLRRGNRLSVLPVTAAEWNFILGLE